MLGTDGIVGINPIPTSKPGVPGSNPGGRVSFFAHAEKISSTGVANRSCLSGPLIAAAYGRVRARRLRGFALGVFLPTLAGVVLLAALGAFVFEAGRTSARAETEAALELGHAAATGWEAERAAFDTCVEVLRACGDELVRADSVCAVWLPPTGGGQ